MRDAGKTRAEMAAELGDLTRGFISGLGVLLLCGVGIALAVGVFYLLIRLVKWMWDTPIS